MQEKAESQKVILDNVVETLNAGFDSIQWTLSAISGGILTMETAVFLVMTFLFVSFLPQYGASRWWLYAVLMGYGLVEGGSGCSLSTTTTWML